MNRDTPKRSLFLLGCDILAILAAFVFGYFLRTGAGLEVIVHKYFLYSSLLIFPLLFYIFDLYYPFRRFTPSQVFVDILLSVMFGMLICAAAAYADRSLILPRTTFIFAGIFLICFIFIIRILYEGIFRSRFLNKKVLIIGTGPLAKEIVQIIHDTPHSGMEIVGYVSENKTTAHKKNGVPIVGSLSDLLSLIDWYGAKLVILAMDPKEDASELKTLAYVLEQHITVTSAIHLFEKLEGDLPYKLLGNHYLLGLMSQLKVSPFLKLKRIMDVIFGSLLLLLLSPPLIVAVILLWMSPPHDVLFMQKRVGRGGRLFKLAKLRSMTKDKNGRPVVTRLGRWMRKYRIDEIPQLINVIKGDMSLIGPRPEIPYFVQRCRKKIAFYDAVFAVKPGLTGWAQVKFWHVTSVKDYDRKFRYNLYYLKNISFALDVLITLKTIRVVVLGRGK